MKGGFYMKKCSLCGGELDRNRRCTLCGLDNTKNDEKYKKFLNRPQYHQRPQESEKQEKNEKRAVSYKAEKYSKTPNKKVQSQEKKHTKIVPVIGFLIVLLAVVPTMIGVLYNIIQEETQMQNSMELEYDPYQYVEIMLPESGTSHVQQLEAGQYLVGVDLPEGNYTATLLEGDYGYVRIQDSKNIIYYTADLIFDEWVEDLRFYEGAWIEVSTGVKIQLETENAQPMQSEWVKNSLTESVELKGEMIAGEDFPEGIYDIFYQPGEDENEFGSIDWFVPMDEWEAAGSVYFDTYGGDQWYRNVAFPKGTMIVQEDLENVWLVPTEQIAQTDLTAIYRAY